jgi:integrase
MRPDLIVSGTRGAYRVRDFRIAWKQLTERAGCPNLLVHDLRRSAVKGMLQAGIDSTTAMKITGHKTKNIFEPYTIVTTADLLDAARKLEEYSRRQLEDSWKLDEEGPSEAS